MSSGFIFNSDNFLRASRRALIKLSFVFVCPFVLLKMSLIPANLKIFAHSFSITSPFPLGAGISVMRTEPHLPVTAKGIEVGCRAFFSQNRHWFPFRSFLRYCFFYIGCTFLSFFVNHFQCKIFPFTLSTSTPISSLLLLFFKYCANCGDVLSFSGEEARYEAMCSPLNLEGEGKI